MTTLMTAPALRHVLALYRGESTAGLTDDGLLRRFLDAREGDGEAADLAFEALVERHGPMVLGVCRRALDDPNDADDAFQATFLVLVRRARAVRVDGSLGPWLYGVARKVAARARVQASRRRARLVAGGESAADPSPGPGEDGQAAEARAAVDEALAGLPERYRTPIVLCGLDGLSYEEAATRLRCPVGTLKSRLTRGRQKLAARLARRGYAPGVLTLPLDRLAVPPALAEATRRLALAPDSPGLAVAALVRPTLCALRVASVRSLALPVVALGLAGGLAGLGLAIGGQEPERRFDVPRRVEAPAATPPLPDAIRAEPNPGCAREFAPARLRLGSIEGQGQSAKFASWLSYRVHDTGALSVVVTQAGTDDPTELRPVAFDAAGRRAVLKGSGGIGGGGKVRYTQSIFLLDPAETPPVGSRTSASSG